MCVSLLYMTPEHGSVTSFTTSTFYQNCFGGVQSKMHDTKLDCEGCLGPHPNTIESLYNAKRPDTESESYDSVNDSFVKYIRS